MFGKLEKLEADAAGDEGEATGHGGLGLAACSPWRAVGIVGRTLRLVASAGPGFKPVNEELKLPRGRVAALDASGPSVLMASGELFVWGAQQGRWLRVGNLNDEPKS